MKIEIAARLRPFSHKPGSYAILPGSTLRLQAFPTRIVVVDMLDQKEIFNAEIGVTGPVDEFTIQQDLEKGDVVVWGKAQEGFFRLRVKALTDHMGIVFAVEKKPEHVKITTSGLHLVGVNCYCFEMNPKKTPEPYQIPALQLERLSLGSHKKQDWEMIYSRQDLEEILPIWHRLGQLIEVPGILPSKKGTLENISNILLACFDGIMAPRIVDSNFTGIKLPQDFVKSLRSPLCLVQYGACMIQDLFVETSPEGLILLPNAFPRFHSGRFINITCPWGNLSFEWTKKAVRRAILHASQDVTITFNTKAKSCRLSGKKYEIGSPLSLKNGETYYFDNFQN